MKNIIFLAPPAAGKGTCSDILKNTYDCKHISTGAILRSEIASQSSLGKEIKKIIDAGKLVSDDYMIKLIEETLSKLDKQYRILIISKTLDLVALLIKEPSGVSVIEYFLIKSIS